MPNIFFGRKGKMRMKKRIGHMKIFSIVMTGVLVLSASLLVSCGDQSGKTEELQVETDVNLDVKEIGEKEYGKAKQETMYAVSADFGEECIILSEPSNETVLNEIPITNDRNELFINMTDEDTGYLLYCSTPAAGMMTKIFYVTKDRWKTYSEMDISSKIDGYPNSLSAVSGEKIYIGAQMRSNGYLFATEDEGENWEAVKVDGDTYFMYGYAPMFDEGSGRAYLLLRTHNEEYEYSLYQTKYPVPDRGNSWNLSWEETGKFMLEAGDILEEYFLYESAIYLMDPSGNYYQIALDN